MANDNYTSGVDPTAIVRVDEDVLGLEPTPSGNGKVRRRRRDRFNGSGKDKITLAEMKSFMTAYWRDGDTYVEIAEKVSDQFKLEGDDRIGASGVHYHIKSLLKTAQKQALLHITERQALILARYDQIEMLVTEAYFASMETTTMNYEKLIKQAKSKVREKQLAEDLKREKERVFKVNLERKDKHRALIKGNFPDSIIGDLPELMEMTAKNLKKFSRVESRPAGDPRWVAMLIDITNKRAQLFGLLNRTDNTNPDQELAKLSDEERESRMAAVLHAAMSRKTGDKGLLAPASPLGGFSEGQKPEPEAIEVEAIEVPDDYVSEVAWEFE